MPARLSHTILRPQECAVALGIPGSAEDFQRDLAGGAKDFVQRFHGDPERYRREFLAPLQRMEETARPLGVTIQPRLTLAEFAALLARPEFRVVVLVAHGYEGRVEFFDGPAPIADVVARIPPAFDGVLDLTCCCHDEQTWQLPIAIRRERPKCLVRFIRQGVTPGIWFGFHAAFFRELAAGQLDYFDTLRKVAESFLETSTMKRQTLRDVFQAYLREIGRLEPVTLGPAAAPSVSPGANARLAAALERQLRSNRYLIITYLSMLCGGLVLAAAVALRYTGSTWNVGIVMASAFAMVAGILEKMRRLWWEKTVMGIAVVLLRERSPEEVARVVETLYGYMLRGPVGGRGHPPCLSAAKEPS